MLALHPSLRFPPLSLQPRPLLMALSWWPSRRHRAPRSSNSNSMHHTRQPYETDQLQQHATQLELHDTRPPLRVKITGYCILTTTIVLVCGTWKGVASYYGEAILSTGLDLVAGTVLGMMLVVFYRVSCLSTYQTARLFWLGRFEASQPPCLPWFYHTDFASASTWKHLWSIVRLASSTIMAREAPLLPLAFESRRVTENSLHGPRVSDASPDDNGFSVRQYSSHRAATRGSIQPPCIDEPLPGPSTGTATALDRDTVVGSGQTSGFTDLVIPPIIRRRWHSHTATPDSNLQLGLFASATIEGLQLERYGVIPPRRVVTWAVAKALLRLGMYRR